MLRCSLGLLLMLAACADLKTADRASDDDELPPAAAPARSTSKTSSTTETAPPKTAADRVAPATTDASAGPSTTTQPAAALCDAMCARRNKCEPSPDADLCVPSCLIDYTYTGPHLSAKYISYVSQCLPALACGREEQECMFAWPAFEPEPTSVPVVNACLVKLRKCPTQLAGNTCYRPLAYDEATRAKIAGCYADDCNDIAGCVDRLMRRF